MHDARKPSKQALNLKLDVQVIYLLKRHALDIGRTVSDVVAEWVREEHIETKEIKESP
jgi:hypothetical protein